MVVYFVCLFGFVVWRFFLVVVCLFGCLLGLCGGRWCVGVFQLLLV